ncbi:hypothetical protein CYMTET_21970 [Cymbomonas tetramitiformis]|uniref:Uncharacterized protein n=1 Tax=Cymbomonas tetramitiformis TaxID=36881 RepID=A0AAE0L2D9_9CHLO|nr:hypothetical protein CYMTET_21970 [Cymbomonas tetramitiformis]
MRSAHVGQAMSEAIPFPEATDWKNSVAVMSSITVTAWATLLSLARYEALPFAWCNNPGAAPDEKQYLSHAAEEWLAARAAEFPVFAEQMEELKETAKAQVQAWDDMHKARLEVIRVEMIPSGMQVRRPKRRYRAMAKARQWTERFLAAHPVFMLKNVGFNDAFSRSERVIMLSTNWLVMVMFSVGFFYSKSTQCCELLRTHVGCDANLNTPCRYEGVEYATCALLTEAWDDDSDPEAGPFDCTAFPQNTFIARLYLVLIMCVLLIPIRLGLSTIFSMSSAVPPVPGHWSIKDAHVRVVFGPFIANLVQAAGFVAYALFMNLDKLNKSVAGLFVTCSARFVVPYIKVGINAAGFLCAKLPVVWGDDVEEAPQRGALLGAACGLLLLLRNKVFGSPMDTCVFAVVITLWLIVTYVLLIYGAQLYDYIGPDAGPTVISAWGWALLFELFGKEAFRIVSMKVTIGFVMGRINEKMVGSSASVYRWYETFVASHLVIEYSRGINHLHLFTGGFGDVTHGVEYADDFGNDDADYGGYD